MRTLDERLAHVQDLMTKRTEARETLDAIEAELEGVLGAGRPTLRPLTVRDKQAEQKKTGRKKSACGKCGRAGHNAKTCAQQEPAEPKPEYQQPPSEAIGPDRYKAIREAMLDKEFMSGRYAMTNKLSPREVNAAVRSKDYSDYLEIRV